MHYVRTSAHTVHPDEQAGVMRCAPGTLSAVGSHAGCRGFKVLEYFSQRVNTMCEVRATERAGVHPTGSIWSSSGLAFDQRLPKACTLNHRKPQTISRCLAADFETEAVISWPL